MFTRNNHDLLACQCPVPITSRLMTFNFSYNAGNNTLALYGSGGFYLMFSRLQE